MQEEDPKIELMEKFGPKIGLMLKVGLSFRLMREGALSEFANSISMLEVATLDSKI